MRALVRLAIGVAFLSSCLNLLLRPRKTLGLAGLALTLAAVILGGADVEIRGDFDRPVHFGLDWFLLNLLVFARVFVPLERAFPLKAGQRVLRVSWTTDIAYYFVNHVGIQLLTFLSLWPAMALAQALGMKEVSRLVSSQPVWLQVLELMLLADLVQYWVHRAFHVLPWLWKFHAVHHSSTAMDWLAGSRMHLVDIVATRGLTFVPLFVLGFAQPAVYAYLVFVSFHAVFIHANVNFRFGALVHLIATPQFHHWHHSAQFEAVDKNFAVHLPWLDRVFGSYYMPPGEWPAAYGIAGNPVPENYFRQFAFPFKRRR